MISRGVMPPPCPPGLKKTLLRNIRANFGNTVVKLFSEFCIILFVRTGRSRFIVNKIVHINLSLLLSGCSGRQLSRSVFRLYAAWGQVKITFLQATFGHKVSRPHPDFTPNA